MAFVDDFPRKASSEFRDFPTTSSLIEGFLESYELRMSFDLAKEFK